jgi:hypothetical protein
LLPFSISSSPRGFKNLISELEGFT